MATGDPATFGPHEEQFVVQEPDRQLCDLALGDVAPAAHLRIQSARHHGLRFLTCEHRNGVLVLEGQVSTFYHKQLAQESVRDVPGVELIQNLVQVISPNLNARSADAPRGPGPRR